MSLNTKGIMAAVVVLTMVFGFVAVGSFSDDSDADDPVAKIGDVTYTTLYDAVEAAKGSSGSTIEVLKDSEGKGIIIPEDLTVTFDFKGHKYTVTSDPAGSTGTKTQCFQLLKNSTVTMRNGTIIAGFIDVKMIIQNYSNLTLTDMTLDATQGTNNVGYVLSNNNGDITINGSTSITAKTGKQAFDVCVTNHYPDGARVTVNTTGSIIGDIEYDVWGEQPSENKTSLSIQAGFFKGSFKIETPLATAAVEKFSITGGTFSDLNCIKYLKSPASGKVTVKLEKDQTLTDTLNVSENLTIDLNGHTITGSDKRAIHVTENTLILTGSGTVTCSGSMDVGSSVIRIGDSTGTSAGLEIGKNVTVTTALSYTVTIFGEETNGQTLTVKGTVSLTGTDAAAISGNGSSNWKETTITIEDGAKVTATSGSAIYHPQAGTLNIAGTVSGPSGLEIKAGGCNVNLLDTAIITATSSTTTHVKNGNGNSTTGYSIAVVENSGYKGNPTLNLSKGTLVGPVALVADDKVTDKKGSITISGGTVKGTISLVNTSETGGTPPAGSITITGGTFSEDPTQFVSEGYIVVQDGEGNYIVGTAVTVTFDSNGGSAVESQTVIFGQKIMKPSDPVKDGYVFKGWYYEGLTEAYDFDAKVTEDLKLYAKWEETTMPLHTVTFMDGTDVFYSTQVEDGKMVPKPTEPTKDDYRFSGWYADATITSKFDFTTKIVEDTALYAGWVQLCYVSVPAGVDGIFTTTNSGVNQIDLSTTTQFTFTVTAADGYELEVYANDEQLTPSGNEYTVTDLSKNVDILICTSKGTEEVQAIETVVENDDGTVTESSAVATVDTATDRIDVKETSVVRDGETTKSSSTTTATIAGSTASISIVTTDAETATISAVIAEAISITGSPVSVNVVVETPKVVIPKGLLTSELVTDLTVNLNTGSSNQATITIPVGAIAAEDIADSFALSVTASSATPSSSDIRGSYAIDAFDLGLTGTNTTVFDKPVTVSYDVTLPSDAKNVRAYCIDEGRFYDATCSNGTVVFTIPHFSAWTIVYDKPVIIVEDDDDILFILEQQKKAREAAAATSQTTTGDDSGEEAAIIIAAAAVAGAMLACAFFAFRRN